MSNNTLDTQQLIEELNELLEHKQFTKLHEVIADTNEMDVAEFMEQLTPLQRSPAFGPCPRIRPATYLPSWSRRPSRTSSPPSPTRS